MPPLEDDEIMREIRAIRDAHAAAYDYDIGRIVQALQEAERASGVTLVARQPRKPRLMPTGE